MDFQSCVGYIGRSSLSRLEQLGVTLDSLVDVRMHRLISVWKREGQYDIRVSKMRNYDSDNIC